MSFDLDAPGTDWNAIDHKNGFTRYANLADDTDEDGVWVCDNCGSDNVDLCDFMCNCCGCPEFED